MKRLLIILSFILTFGITAQAESIARKEGKISLPKTYFDSEIQLMSNANETEAEARILKAFINLEEEIDLSDLEINIDDIKRIYNKVVHENPIYYYVDSTFWYSYYADNTIEYLYPDYTDTDLNAIKETIHQINEATEEILLCIDDDMSEFQKVLTVHDYMVLNYEYDTDYEIYDIRIMTEKKGVCDAYTKAFTHLMDIIGVENSYVSSEEMNHIWNIVKINGKWYNIDLTWDDPINGIPGQVYHTFALLSDYRLQHMEDNPHYAYDNNGADVSSDLYDYATWHDNIASIVTVNDVEYWVSGNRIVDHDGNVIYSNLGGGDRKWDLGNNIYFPNIILTGLASYNGKLYFNTDNAIYSYNPKNKKLKVEKSEKGICGLYVDRNNLKYCKFNTDTNEYYMNDSTQFHLNDVRYSKPYIKNNKVISRIYKDTDEPTMVFSFGDGLCQGETIKGKGLKKFEFDISDKQTLFIWDKYMNPLCDKVTFEN